MLSVEFSLVAHAQELGLEEQRRLPVGSGGLNELFMVFDVHNQLNEIDSQNILGVIVLLSSGLVYQSLDSSHTSRGSLERGAQVNTLVD